MRTTVQVIPENTQDIRKRAYRDFSIARITKKQLNKILDHLRALNGVAQEIRMNSKENEKK